MKVDTRGLAGIHAFNTRAMATVTVMACAIAAQSRAAEIDVGHPDVKVRWDNTFKYSAAIRTERPSPAVIAAYNPNLDDGDDNFKRGLVSNRLDILSEFDVVYQGSMGMRLSGAGWYDTVYNEHNHNPGFAGGAVPNSLSVPYDDFTKATRKQQGRDAEVLDAFVFGKANVGDSTLSGRLGRHTLLWGESLFFGENGIAGGQAPIDGVKRLSVPNSQFKEVIRPVNQLSGQLQINPTVSVAAYLQLEWRPDRIPAAGSYLSRTDVLDVGGERLYLSAALGGPVDRIPDIKGKNTGQGGVQLRWTSEALDTDFGFYAIRYNDKSAQVYVQPGVDYRLVYHDGTRAYGVSASKSIGSYNLAAEASIRRNTSLVAAGGTTLDFTGTGNGSSNPLYPVGNSAHGQVSMIHTLDRSDFWDGGLVMAEVAWNRRLRITKNAAALDPNTTRDALGLRVLAAPTWFQAFSGVDLTVPVGVGYNPHGRSSVVSMFNGGWDHGGDLSAGLNFDVRQTWKAGINYTYYFGKAGGVLDPNGSYTFAQALKDRNFISLMAQRAF